MPIGTDKESQASLLASILADAQELVEHEVALARWHIVRDVRRVMRGMLWIGVGMMVCLFGTFVTCLAIAHWLVWLFPSFPLWGSYAVVGVTILIGGLVLLYFTFPRSGIAEQFSFVDPERDR